MSAVAGRYDSFGLPGQVLVRLSIDAMGALILRCVSERNAKAVGRSNAYDGSAEVYIQDPQLTDWLDTLPRSAFYGRGKDRDFNDGARFLLDSWTFRHLVGGQSD